MAIQQVLADVVTGTDPARARVNALRVMADSTSVSAPPAIRIRELPAHVGSRPAARAGRPGRHRGAAGSRCHPRACPAAAVSAGQLEEALLEVAREPSRGRELRVLALSALPDAAPLTPDLFDLLSTSLQLEPSSAARATAADVVGRRRLTREQLRALLPALASASAIELPRLLAPFGNDSDEGLGLAMLDALDRSPARAALRADALRPRLAKSPGIGAGRRREAAGLASRRRRVAGTPPRVAARCVAGRRYPPADSRSSTVRAADAWHAIKSGMSAAASGRTSRGSVRSAVTATSSSPSSTRASASPAATSRWWFARRPEIP